MEGTKTRVGPSWEEILERKELEGRGEWGLEREQGRQYGLSSIWGVDAGAEPRLLGPRQDWGGGGGGEQGHLVDSLVSTDRALVAKEVMSP